MQPRSSTTQLKDTFTPFDYVPTSQSPLYYGESSTTEDTIAAFHPHSHHHPHESIDSLPSFPPNPLQQHTSTTPPPIQNNQPQVVHGLLQELRSLAALESSIYLARTRTRPPLIALHTPARRLARTIVTFGMDEGIVFGLRALRAIEAVAEGCRDDVRGLCFWWSNCIQLRWMLWAMCGGAEATTNGNPDMNEFTMVMKSLVPPLRHLEARIFDLATEHLWERVMLPVATHLAGHVDMADQQPTATARWLAALTQALLQLLPVNSMEDSAYVRLLKCKVMVHVLHRLDTHLFAALQHDPQHAMHAMHALHPWSSSNHLTFADGMAIKIALTRWQHWARDYGITPQGEQYEYFPRLRAASNLLMLPKEQVMDHSIRGDIAPGLSPHQIQRILARFKPDEFAPDAIPKGVMERLRRECAAVAEGPHALQVPKYVPVAETVLLSERLIEPVSLEMDADSDDELEGLCGVEESVCRFALLRDVWVASGTGGVC